ncbi:caspase-3-like protein, partial [Leptotrombidium deliense]
HEKFDNNELEERKGNKADKDAIDAYFREINFIVRVYEDKTVDEIENILRKYAKNEENLSYGVLVCFILTHGNRDHLCAKDSHYKLNKILEPFLPGNCEILNGRPKLFIINACQGEVFDEGNVVHYDACDVPLHTPEADDFLVTLSSVPGFKSFRHKIIGSYYVQHLIETLRKSRSCDVNEDIHSILTTVHDKIAFKALLENQHEKISAEEEKDFEKVIQMPIFLSSLRDELAVNRHYTNRGEFFKKATETTENYAYYLKKVVVLIRMGLQAGGFLYKVDPLEIDTEQLKSFVGEQILKVNERLNIIEDKIDHINLVLQDELVKDKLRIFLHNRNNIKEALDSFAKNPNSINAEELKKTCADKSMRSFLNFLHTEIMDAEANFVYAECFTAIYSEKYDDVQFNQTLNDVFDKFQEMLQQIVEKMEIEHNEFYKTSNVMQWAKEDVESYMKKHSDMSHEQFSKGAVNTLIDKYEWRTWIVGSYDKENGFCDEHVQVGTRDIAYVRTKHNRCVFIVSLNKTSDDYMSSNELNRLQADIKKVLEAGKYSIPHTCKTVESVISRKFNDKFVICINNEESLEVQHSKKVFLKVWKESSICISPLIGSFVKPVLKVIAWNPKFCSTSSFTVILV